MVQGQTLTNFAIFLPHKLWNLQWWITICFHTSLLHSLLHQGKAFQAILRTIKSPGDSLMWPKSRNLDSTPSQVGFVLSVWDFFLILVSWFQHHQNFTKTCWQTHSLLRNFCKPQSKVFYWLYKKLLLNTLRQLFHFNIWTTLLTLYEVLTYWSKRIFLTILLMIILTMLFKQGYISNATPCKP